VLRESILLNRVSQPSVCVVIVHHKGVEILSECLASVFKTTYRNMHVVLVDNGSKDGSVAIVQKLYGNRLFLVKSEANLGFVGGNNLALRQVEGDYVVLLNDDTVVHPEWLQHLVEVAEADHSIGALQPKLLSLSDPQYFEYNGCAGGMLDVYGVPLCRGRVFDTIEKDEGQYDDVAEIAWASGAAILIRQNVLKDVGLLDDMFYAHMEEIDFCWRVRLKGYKIMAVPKAVVYHRGGGTPLGEKFYLKQRNNLIVMVKNYSSSSLLRFLPGRAALDAFSFFYFSLRRNSGRCLSILKAYVDLLSMLKGIIEGRHKVQRNRIVPDYSILKIMLKKSVAIQHYLMRKTSFNSLSGWNK
jgi:GT2 family glycosyltransferase